MKYAYGLGMETFSLTSNLCWKNSFNMSDLCAILARKIILIKNRSGKLLLHQMRFLGVGMRNSHGI